MQRSELEMRVLSQSALIRTSLVSPGRPILHFRWRVFGGGLRESRV